MKYCISLLIFQWIVFMAHTQTLGLATDKTTSLVFPFPIKHVDRGTESILTQQVKGERALLIKAANKDFPETNLTVFTEDGSVYTFRVQYDPLPRTWIYRLPVFSGSTIAGYANGILDNPATIRGMRDRKWNIELYVKGIYVKDDVMYCQLQVWNQSPIDYNIELLRFFIRDKKRARRTASQENELEPLYRTGKVDVIKAHSNNTIVVALDKFTSPDAKVMYIQLVEKNGGRHLQVKVQNRDLMRARVLPEPR